MVFHRFSLHRLIQVNLFQKLLVFGTRRAEVQNSIIMKITANENDTNDILQTFPSLLYWFLDLMIINFENTASHKYVVQKVK